MRSRCLPDLELLGWFGSGLGVTDVAVMLMFKSSRAAAEPNQEDGIKKAAGRVGRKRLRGRLAPRLSAN